MTNLNVDAAGSADTVVNINLTEEGDRSSQGASKVASFAYNFFTSPLVMAVAGIGSSYIFLPTSVAVIGTVASLAILKMYSHKLPKTFLYELTLVYNFGKEFFTKVGLMNCPRWSEIDDGIILGSIPLESYGDKQEIVGKLKPGALLAVLEDFELSQETFFSRPIPLSFWETECGMDVLQISVEDMSALTVDQLDQGANFINSAKDKKVLVHCKAGMGRSACVLIAYYIKYKGYSYQGAHDFINEKRSINIKPWQKLALLEFERRCRH